MDRESPLPWRYGPLVCRGCWLSAKYCICRCYRKRPKNSVGCGIFTLYRMMRSRNITSLEVNKSIGKNRSVVPIVFVRKFVIFRGVLNSSSGLSYSTGAIRWTEAHTSVRILTPMYWSIGRFLSNTFCVVKKANLSIIYCWMISI